MNIVKNTGVVLRVSIFVRTQKNVKLKKFINLNILADFAEFTKRKSFKNDNRRSIS